MLMSSSQRVACLLFCFFFHIAEVFGRGGGKVGEEGEGVGVAGDLADAGSSFDDAGSNLGLDPELSAVFATAIVVTIISAGQFLRSLTRFKHLPIPAGESTLPYDVGILFRVFLAAYTAIFTTNNALYATYIASLGDTIILQPAFQIGMAFTGQFALVLFYATFLTIIAYRQRIQLNPQENLFNLKSLLDSFLLVTILVLGVAEDSIAGASQSIESAVAINNIIIAFNVFSFLASLDVAISAVAARIRLSKAGIQDKIINTCAFVVGPTILLGGLYGIIDTGIEQNADVFTFDFEATAIASVVIGGVVSIVAVAFGLNMGVPSKRPQASHGGAVEKHV